MESLRSIAKKLGVSHSYLVQIRQGKRPPSKELLTKLLTIGLNTSDVCGYNLDSQSLGHRLAVGQRTLDPYGKVRILVPQPVKTLSGLLFVPSIPYNDIAGFAQAFSMPRCLKGLVFLRQAFFDSSQYFFSHSGFTDFFKEDIAR